ncbi:hypothetical protein Nocox_34205 [Nonomuraea coxensis DSM 45129]|uniref:Uncharacterized protein n=1 Tax=Nonomuraea coxensis DSM 45129 TaxID=1122611 RepID=A0ABX8U9J8_9ACTN|nr:hypothetical protein [Nonomuraea coxensis]QYC44407.1 hypothetical protein Nocox_34205 [Nonomuraea coxensis DSM 45129]
MSAYFGLRSCAVLAACSFGALTAVSAPAHADTDEKILLKGSTTASYFWDDGSGRAGDTGLPASGKPMQKGLAASPSWPLLTEGYVMYKGKKMPFFVGDRGPGVPSNRGIMLDLDAKTFAELTGGRFNSATLGVDGIGGQGHIKVDYVITKWGPGVGKKNHPVPFSTGAWSRRDNNPAEPPKVLAEEKPATTGTAQPAKVRTKTGTQSAAKAVQEKAGQSETPAQGVAGGSAGGAAVQLAAGQAGTVRQGESAQAGTGVGGALLWAALALGGGAVVLGGNRLRRLLKRGA